MASTKSAKSPTAKRVAVPATKSKSAPRRAKKAVAAPKASRKRADKPVVAAPLLATALKKVGKVTAKTTDAVKPAAPYQPQTEAAPSARPKNMTPRAVAVARFDPLALTRPWMRLALQMTMSNLALQARIVRTVMDLPSTAVAMRQGSVAYSTWLAMLGRARPSKG